MICGICPHNCDVVEGSYGICGARKCIDGAIVCDNYGKITSLSLDPIEKKPLYHFYPGSKIVSVGSYGCNMKCGYCQNWKISQTQAEYNYFPPEYWIENARRIPKDNNNIGVAFTYNEPLIGFEYIVDCAKLLKSDGQKVVLVSNGQINTKPLEQLAPLVDAWNIDIKAWSADFYKRHGGDFETAKRTVEIASKTAHVEVTTLIIPGENDNEIEIATLAEWLASVSSDTPYHLSRYFPRYKYEKLGQDTPESTPKDTLYRLADVARSYLKNVYVGNV